MNIFLILLSFGLAGVSLVIAGTLYAEAQTINVIEGYTPDDKDKKFLRLQFELYFRASNVGDGDLFLNMIETQRAVKTLKSIPVKAKLTLWCDHETHGQIYLVNGAYVFKNDLDAQQIRDWLQVNIPFDKIDYAEFYLLENNHHWDRPTPDKILQHRTLGNENVFRQVEAEC